MDFFNYCSRRENELIRTLEQKLSSKILEFELEKLEDDFLVFVSMRGGNNRLLIKKEGIVKREVGHCVAHISEVFKMESDNFRKNK